MKILPRKRVILSWHKWLGIGSALFLMVLSITGLALNHTERLGLDEVKIRNKWILERYGMLSQDSQNSYRINDRFFVSQVGTAIFLNEKLVSSAEQIVGTFLNEYVFAVVTSSSMLLFTSEGDLIETIHSEHLEFEKFHGVGKSELELPVFITTDGLYTIDADWLNISRFEGNFQTIPLEPFALENELRQKLLESFQGETVSLYRVVLDLHSGRLFGWSGRTLMDLTAIAILLLLGSGIAGWLRRSRAMMEMKKQ